MVKMYHGVIDQSNENPGGDIERIELNKDEPYIMDSTFYRYEFYKNKEVIEGYTTPEINRTYQNIIYRMGLSGSSLTTITKPFKCLKSL